MKYYFISYSDPRGLGNCLLRMEGLINIRDTEQYISREFTGNSQVAITNFIEVSEAQASPTREPNIPPPTNPYGEGKVKVKK